MSRSSFAGRAAVVLAVALALAAAPRSAAAQEQGGDAATRRREASAHVKQGDQYKEKGAYDAAAREYQAAYELVPHPVLFFNLAQVYRLKGDRAQALEYYERYLAGDPDGRASGQARHFAAELRAAIERDRAAARERERRQRAPRPAGGTIRVGPDDGQGGSGPRDAGEPPPGRALRVGGLVLAGAGVVSLGVGVAFGLKARGISNDLDGHQSGPWPDDLLARQNEGESAEISMFILTSAGVAGIAAGGLLYYMGRRADRAAPGRGLGVTPVVGDRPGVAVFGRF